MLTGYVTSGASGDQPVDVLAFTDSLQFRRELLSLLLCQQLTLFVVLLLVVRIVILKQRTGEKKTVSLDDTPGDRTCLLYTSDAADET